jgi:secreted PhoX family phosphatase
VDTSFHTKELIVPGGKFKYRILFHEGDEVLAEWADTLGMAKGSHDFLAFLPLGKAEDHGILWVNHEAHSPHDVLGDGGGATVMEVFRDSTGDWRVIGMPQAVDFREVGGTLSNCLGAVTPWGTVLTSEETEPLSMRQLCESPGNCAIRDSAGVGGWARWKNYGWMVEVDPLGRKAIRKHHSMGRFMHEGAYCMPDQRTVFLMDDIGPGAFFKFVADRPKDLSQGVLYAFKQGPNGQGGSWIQLPRERDSLLIARELAFKKGATAFIRMEDIELHPDGSFFITETGLDSVDFNQALVWGAQPAKHLAGKHVGNGIYDDKFGRILKFDPSSNQISVYLEGGPGRDDQSIHLSNPDNIALDTKRNQLVIHEDLVGRNAGRLPSNSQSVLINEIYFLDLGIQKPTLDDLQRFAVIPAGAESTGGIWSPDFSAYFFNLQHPSETNPAPFNKACTVVVTGW